MPLMVAKLTSLIKPVNLKYVVKKFDQNSGVEN